MLLIALLYYLMATAISSQQDHSARWTIVGTSLTGILLAPIIDLLSGLDEVIPVFNEALFVSQMTGHFIILALAVTYGMDLLFIQNSVKYDDSKGYVLYLGLIGTLLLIAANSFAVVLLALELQSFAAYLLVASGSTTFLASDPRQDNISSIKSSLVTSLNYFFWGSLASAFLVLGLGLQYSSLGCLSISNISWIMNHSDLALEADWSSFLFTAGVLLILLALFFKIGAAPLHFWTPLVYSQVDNRLISFLALVPKIGVLVLLNNLIMVGSIGFLLTLLVICLSLIIGALGGLKASSFRELIAYSSVNHVGFILILLIVGSLGITVDNQDLLFYLSQYSLTLVIALSAISFADYSVLPNNDNNRVGQSLFSANKFLFTVLAVAILSMAGIPPFIGFFSKLIVFIDAINNGLWLLTLVALLSSIMTAYYYLIIMAKMTTTISPRIHTDSVQPASTCVACFAYIISTALMTVSGYALLF